MCDRRQLRFLFLLVALLAGLSALWMWQGLPASANSFILKLRMVKLFGLITVGAAVAVATMLFQTVAANRVLTPSIMGFDSLYVLLQTVLVFTLGVTGFVTLPVSVKFLAEVLVLCLLATALFGTLLAGSARDIPRMILTGVILGVFFRSLSGFLSRLIDPNTYAVVQSTSFASFNSIKPGILPWAALISALAIGAAWRLGPRLDVLALGRNVALPLGLRFDRMVVSTLALVSVLVAVSTALVGPVAFFGLIVAGLTHGLTRSARHRLMLPAAALIAANILVGGQFLFERMLGQQATLSVVVEFAGGLFFLYLLIRGRVR
ncbi:iron chelate uptake ABC transporter family permease subunit [Paracoccus aminophilus]|uniref:ABC cobalamin/Fe3+-siderophore transporter, inner membrane subunit n=1 Tax=Paracoccus aminophilus JCM 7686 TaxID=1367847 RepID=S5Z1Q9_PARAH|nr:iron chelate uptake ABC transporter family permease subunit [Paracoccus aminophilus]AGT11376.1 ABC cobalamin/Fe3+-siderophore transporter, inner membrane subunit [Paracoccus aminophilus JCM 7686]